MSRLHRNRAKTLVHATENNDCGVRALAASCNVSYRKAYKTLEELGRKPRGTTHIGQLRGAIRRLGKRPRLRLDIPGVGVSVKNISREIPEGSWIVHTHDHWIGVVDGKVIDWARGGLRRPDLAIEVAD